MAITTAPHQDPRTFRNRCPDWIFHETRGALVKVHRFSTEEEARMTHDELNRQHVVAGDRGDANDLDKRLDDLLLEYEADGASIEIPDDYSTIVRLYRRTPNGREDYFARIELDNELCVRSEVVDD